MVEKMMRIAGRGKDGLAKAINTDNEGNISSQIFGSLLQKKKLYNNGAKTVEWEIGYQTAGDVSYTEDPSYLKLVASGATSKEEISVVTSEPVDLTNVSSIEFEWEKPQTNHLESYGYFIISKNKSFSSANRNEYLFKNKTFDKTKEVIPVTHLEGTYYIRFHAQDASIMSLQTTELWIHSVTLNSYDKKVNIPVTVDEKGELVLSTKTAIGEVPQSGGGYLNVVDKEDNSVALTAELDDDGKAVLRTFDAAPHNQDPTTDSVKSLPQKKVRMDDVFSATLAVGEERSFNIAFENESKVWVHIEASQPNWTLKSGTIYKMSGNRYKTFYPNISDIQDYYVPSGKPKIARWLGVSQGDSSTQLPTEITNIRDAEDWAIPPGNHSITFYAENLNETEENTITVRVVRVWG